LVLKYLKVISDKLLNVEIGTKGYFMAKHQNLIIMGETSGPLDGMKDKIKKENEKAKVIVADSLDMADALIMTHTPAVVIATDMSQFAKFLTKNQKQIISSSTKSILFCDAEIPPKVMNMLNRMGMNDHLGSSVNPKTLYYKINLLLRALPIDEEEDGVTVVKDNRTRDDDDNMRVKKVHFVTAKTGNEGVEIETSKGRIDATMLSEFCDESDRLCTEMEDLLDKLEEDLSQTDLLGQYSQLSDRIMGAAYTLGLEGIATFCDLGKTIGIKSQKIENEGVLEIVLAVLFDSATFLKGLIAEIRKGSEDSLKHIGKQGFIKRLKWLSQKFEELGLDKIKGKEDRMDQGSIDDLLSSLGL
jgi:hypothetical protein